VSPGGRYNMMPVRMTNARAFLITSCTCKENLFPTTNTDPTACDLTLQLLWSVTYRSTSFTNEQCGHAKQRRGLHTINIAILQYYKITASKAENNLYQNTLFKTFQSKHLIQFAGKQSAPPPPLWPASHSDLKRFILVLLAFTLIISLYLDSHTPRAQSNGRSTPLSVTNKSRYHENLNPSHYAVRSIFIHYSNTAGTIRRCVLHS